MQDEPKSTEPDVQFLPPKETLGPTSALVAWLHTQIALAMACPPHLLGETPLDRRAQIN